MTTKLTLSIDEQVIKKAKLVSRRKGKSLSKMVEEYLSTISIKEDEKESPLDRIKKIRDAHSSKIKPPLAEFDYKTEWHKHLDEKYGKKPAKKK